MKSRTRRWIIVFTVALFTLAGTPAALGASAASGPEPPVPEVGATTSNPCGTPPWGGLLQIHQTGFGPAQPWAVTYCPRPDQSQTALVNLGYHGIPLQYMCVAGGTEVHVGTKMLTLGPGGWAQYPPHEPGELLGHSAARANCDPSQGPSGTGPPVVHVTGTVKSKNVAVPGEPARPFANATWALEAYTRADGQQDAEPEWQPVTSEPGGEGRPVTGALDEQGRFDISFIYPQDYLLENGTMWYGCPVVEPAVRFMRSHACRPDDLVLRIYAGSEDGSVWVRDEDEDETAVIGEIPLGWFFTEDDVHQLDSPGGHAYNAAYRVKNLTASLPEEQRLSDVRIHLYDSLTNSGGYGPATRTIVMKKSETAYSDAEFHVGMHHYHDLLGEDYPGIPDNCRAEFYAEETDAKCALQMGFAGAMANAAEAIPNRNVINLAGVDHDVENCEATAAGCEKGAKVGARVGAALRDLTDPGQEIGDGFTDSIHRPFAELPPMIAEAGVTTAEKFWDAYRERHGPGDRLIMFMNTLEYTTLWDEDRSSTTGPWQTTLCPMCRGDDMATGSGDPLPPTLIWEFMNPLDRPTAFDLWVRLPAGQLELADQATYTISDLGLNEIRVVVDQTVTGDGWLNLRPSGFGPFEPDGPFSVTLSSQDGRPVVADAIIAAPHEDGTTGPYPPVQVSGGVHTLADSASGPRPLGGACYEVLYRGHDGNPLSPVQWRPVLDSAGPDGRPAGAPVRGCLTQDGRFTTGFVYPNTFALTDGTTWTGCPVPANPVEFQGAHACAPEDLVLRVSARDAAGRDMVKLHYSEPSAAVAGDVPLGHFFLKDPADSTVLDTEEAFAFGAILSVRELMPTFTKNVLIELNDGDYSHYIPGVVEERVVLARVHARSTIAEREVARVLEHQLIGDEYDIPMGCPGNDVWMTPTSEECAWRGGFPAFLGTLAEKRYSLAEDDDAPGFNGYNIERCYHWSCGDRGPDVEGRVAMTLWDLYDATPDENTGGFLDLTGFGDPSLTQIMDIVRETSPESIGEFWTEYNTRHDRFSARGEETMWLNGMLYAFALDAGDEHTELKGTWEEKDCPEDCMGGSYEQSAEPAATATWDIGELLEDDGDYEIWVKLPLSEDELDSGAVYTVMTDTGPVPFTVDQMSVRWVNLKEQGLTLDEDTATVTLSHGPAGPALPMAAEAILVVPASVLPG
ncbi:hypothetical protein ABGB17_11385 [Sphaerisporangium sp. B11E5]|uniref:golvesin C-terminal-like domain-containing protein n=1 Tax=Sphaerisporangium sp. B11E5 TaxID=3153563 RepID=UPI00325D0B6F